MKLTRLPERRILKVEGSERVEFLQGQLSSNVRALAPGGGQASLLLSAQGRVEAIVTLYDAGDAIEIACEERHAAAVQARIERFLIADDVELSLEPAPATTLVVTGAEAAARLGELAGTTLAHGWQRNEVVLGGVAAVLRARGEFREPWLEISTGASADALERALAPLGAQPGDEASLAQLHVTSGVARYGIDVDESRMALEARLQWAIHFAKGCYVGQEVVERSVSRGRLNRRLALLASRSVLPVGARVDGGAEVETVTSSIASSSDGALSLAYLNMESTNPGTSLSVGGVEARVVEWPMREVYVGLRA